MTDADAHRTQVDAWREGRYADLRRDLGWLTLAGLGWLGEGVNRVGSAPDNDIVIPGGPARAGTLTLAGEAVTADGDFLVDGESVRGLRLVDDHDGGTNRTLLEVDHLRLCIIRRGDRLGVRTWDLDAPQRRNFGGIDHWRVDPAWRLEGRFEPTPGRRILVPDVLGPGYEEERPGDVVFSVDGDEHRLEGLAGGSDGELWLVFGDTTNGTATYAGGRFLYTDPPDAGGRVIVDFNRAYNPPCVFSPYATCPLPWPANRLPIRVEAGERMYDRP